VYYEEIFAFHVESNANLEKPTPKMENIIQQAEEVDEQNISQAFVYRGTLIIQTPRTTKNGLNYQNYVLPNYTE